MTIAQYITKPGWKWHEVDLYEDGNAVTLCGMWLPFPYETFASSHDPSQFCKLCARISRERGRR